MKKLTIAGCLGLFLGIVLLCCPSARAAGNLKFYFGGEGAYSFTTLKSGGQNLSGGFDNIGSDTSNKFGAGGHFGLEFSGLVSLDLGFHYRAKQHFTTPSFVDIPPYFYETDVDAYSLMFSVTLNVIQDSPMTPYFGVGIGGTKIAMKTDDTVVNGSVDSISFSWQGEAGLQFTPTGNFALRIGYRYLNLGKAELTLYDLGLQAGNFTGTLTAHEILGGLRISF